MQQPAITLEQWQTLLAVVERGGIAAAADALGMSHSAVTLTIARIHDALGLTIIDIDGKTARFTGAGSALAQRARMLLRDAQAVEELADNLRLGWENQIRVAFDNTFPVDTMIEALRNFAPLSRGTRVSLRETGTAEAEAALHAGSVDVVITTRVPDGYLSEPLTTVRLMAVIAPSHPLAGTQGTISAFALARELVVEVRDAPRARVMANESAPRWTVASNETARTLVARGHGYAWLPVQVVQSSLDDGTLVLLDLSEGNATPVTAHMVLAHPKQQGPATRTFTEILRAHCANLK